MKKLLLIILFCLYSGFSAQDCLAVSKGEKSPVFKLSDSEGNVIDLNNMAGKPVLIAFVDTSAISMKKLSSLAEIFDYYKYTELEIIPILVGESQESASKYQTDQWLTYTLYGDSERKVAQLYDIKEFPQVVILGNDHIIRYIEGYGTDEELRAQLLKYMNEKVFVITARQFEYEPNIIKVNKGDTVVLKLLSEDVEHGIYLDGYELRIKQYLDRDGNIVEPEKADKNVKPGELGLLRFVADKSGRFSMRCSATCASFHPYMYGWLRVDPNTRFSASVLLAFLLGGFFLYFFSKEKNRNRILGLIPIDWRFEITRYPLIRGLIKNRWPRYLAIMFSTVFFTVILVSCYVGGVSAGNFNFGIMYVWIVWFVLLIMIWVPFFSRIFCGFCPLPFFGLWLQRHSVMSVMKKSFGLNKKFPKSLSNMWMVNFLFMGITFFNGFLTTIPIASFYMLIGIIIAATAITFVFEKRTWCRFVCPVGGFQGLYSNAATLEIRSKDPEVCNRVKDGKEYPFDEGIAACRLACPAGVDSSTYIALIEKGKYERALEVIREAMPFPGVCGRVCNAPCEVVCSRGKLDAPISIRALKRFVSDYVGYGNGDKHEFVPTHKEKIAIIGSGPAGLSGAYYLAKDGYAVTVYESLPVIGGMFKVGLPDFHLPKDIVDKEIEFIKNSGVTYVPDTTIGKDISFESLQKEYQSVFIAVGASKSRLLKLEGEDLQGVATAIDLLRKVNSGEKVEVGKKVVVLGGGKTAIDVARVAIRLGCEDVTCLEIRSEEEMGSLEKQAVEEGVKIKHLTTALKIVGSGGKATSLLCADVRLGEINQDTGLHQHITIRGSEHLISADTIIVAVGQYSDIDFLPKDISISKVGTIIVDPLTMATNIPGVFAGGDVVTGPSVFVDSVKAGRKAAVSIARHLRGERLEPVLLYPTMKQVADLPLHSVSHKDRVEPTCIPLEERHGNFREVENVFTERMAREESSRCLGCGSCGMCYRGNEKGYGCPWMELPFRNRRNTYCGLCLECFKTCPEDNMAVNIRPPATDLLVDEKRGFDEAWKSFIMLGAAVVFYVFMMGPWGFLKDWQRAATTFSIFKYIATSAISCLIVLPSIFGIFVLASNWLKKDDRISFKKLFINHSYTLAPLGLLTWIAFCFGFLLPSGSYLIHVTSDPFAWGWNLFGTAGFPWTPFLTYYMPFLQIGALLFGLIFSIDIGIKISRQTFADEREAIITFIPILAFLVCWTVTMLWLFLW
ncbi:MAG: FAD-dependent oxidoreductase [Candidatus Latescibacter sp.]|nr:FAD-dependent oxidoreductase [Candidatus Latescibacter sp.]